MHSLDVRCSIDPIGQTHLAFKSKDLGERQFMQSLSDVDLQDLQL